MVCDPEQNVVPDSRCDESEYEHALLSGAASPRPIAGRRAAWAGAVAAATLVGVMVVAIVAKPGMDNGGVGDLGWEGSLARLNDAKSCKSQYCLNIVTGGGLGNDGHLKVHLNAGEGLQEVAHGHFFKYDIVERRCFSNPIEWVEVQNEKKNGWTGTISYSMDGGETYEAMVCSFGCNTKGLTSTITVEGDADEKRSAVRCIDGETCRLTQNPTQKPDKRCHPDAAATAATATPVTTAAPVATADFDCTVEHGIWKIAWSDAKKKFCCRVANRGCEFECKKGEFLDDGWAPRRKQFCCLTQGNCKSPSGMFNCAKGKVGWEKGWSDAKKKFCCKHNMKAGGGPPYDGCEADFDCNTGEKNWKTQWSPEKQQFCCDHGKDGCEFDCDEGKKNWEVGWSDDKKKFCCAAGKCEQEDKYKGLDCTVEKDDWENLWSDEKKQYCCDRGDDTCNFDCKAELDNWERGWSESKKVFCCLAGKGECDAKTKYFRFSQLTTKFNCIQAPLSPRRLQGKAAGGAPGVGGGAKAAGGAPGVGGGAKKVPTKEKALLEECTSVVSQAWRLTDADAVKTQIRNTEGRCITADKLAIGKDVIVDECDGASQANQYMTFDGTSLKFVDQAAGTEFCIEPGANNHHMKLSACVAGQKNQQWAMEEE